MKISACVIVKNEENSLPTWLDCVRKFADEWIVVDTGSTDRTIEIARQGRARVEFFQWIGDFAAAKNYALDQATGDWIVFMDADEYFSEDAAEALRPYLESIHRNRRIAGLVSPMLNIDTDNGNRIISKIYQMRVFRRENSLRFEGHVHEKLVNLAAYTGIREFRLTDLLIYHTGYRTGISKEKIKRNLQILLDDVQRNGGEKVDQFAYFLQSYLSLGEYDKAVHYGELALKYDEESHLVGITRKICLQLLYAMKCRGDSIDCRKKFLEEKIRKYQDWPELFWKMGEIFFEEQDYLSAEKYLLQALQLTGKPEKNPEKLMEGVIENDLPYLYGMLGKICAMQEKRTEAAEYWKKSLKAWPWQEEIFQLFYREMKSEGKTDEIFWLGQLYSRKEDRNFLETVMWKFPMDETYRVMMDPLQGSYEEAVCNGDISAAVTIAEGQLATIHKKVAEKFRKGEMGEERGSWEQILPKKFFGDDGEHVQIKGNSSLISILIPTYERPEFFEQALKSALAQTYRHIEVLVCDNSRDNRTEQLIQPYLSDERLIYRRNTSARSKWENFQPFEDMAKGEYLQWLMDDDLLAPDKLEKMIRCFQKHPCLTLVTSQRAVIDAENHNLGIFGETMPIQDEYRIFSGHQIAHKMLMSFSNFLGEPSAVLFRRRDLKHHYWRAECKGYQRISDVAMWLELLEKGDCAIFRDSLSYYRCHAAQEGKQFDVILQSRLEWIRLIGEYFQRKIFLESEEDFLKSLSEIYREYRGSLSQLAAHRHTKIMGEYEACMDEIRQILREKGGGWGDGI